MAVDKESLKLYIKEQERYHDELTSTNAALKTRNTTYIGAILALLAFLYVSALGSNKPYAERLFIPHDLYGQIFYAAGLFFLLFALGKLLHGARPNGTWAVGYESRDAMNIESMAEEDYLVKLKDDNEGARKHNTDQYNKKLNAVKDSFYPMLIGAIIMIVLRYFQ